MRDTQSARTVELVPVSRLEAVLRERMGWVDRAISPFAIAARSRAKTRRLRRPVNGVSRSAR